MAHLSDSKAQMVAEKLILSGVEKYLELPYNSLKTEIISLDTFTNIEIDGYSEEHRIMVEVFSRIGKLAPAHCEKLANDILKLKLAEDKLNRRFKKYLAVCGEEAERYLNGSAWKAFAARYYDFEVVRIDLDNDDRRMILEAQSKQKEGMKL